MSLVDAWDDHGASGRGNTSGGLDGAIPHIPGLEDGRSGLGAGGGAVGLGHGGHGGHGAHGGGSRAMPGGLTGGHGGGGGGDGGFVHPSLRAESTPLFRPQRVDLKLTRDQRIDRMVSANNVLLIALDSLRVIRVNRDRGEIDDIEVPRARPEDFIHRVFLDPTGVHAVISMGSGENYYLHALQRKPKVLKQLKGHVIESIAWDPANVSESTTRDILLGSANGTILECCIESNNRVQFRPVYNLNVDQPVTGIAFEHFPAGSSAQDGQKYFVMATTATRYFQFVGGPTFEQLFASYAVNPGFTELPGDLEHSELHFYSQHPGRAQSFAWLTGPGVYSGEFSFGSQTAGDSVVTNATLFPYHPLEDGSHPGPPESISVSAFHFLLAYPDRFLAVSRLSDEKVFEWYPNLEFVGTVRGLARDHVRGTAWLYSEASLFEIAITDEDRDVWRLYLEKGAFDMAFQYCKDPSQRDTVHTAQADHFFKADKFELAAQFYAKTQRPFEEVALRFVSSGEWDALKTYLLHKMDHLSPSDATQLTAIATWLTEIYLDKINTLQDSAAIDGGGMSSADAITSSGATTGSGSGSGSGGGGGGGGVDAAGGSSISGVSGQHHPQQSANSSSSAGLDSAVGAASAATDGDAHDHDIRSSTVTPSASYDNLKSHQHQRAQAATARAARLLDEFKQFLVDNKDHLNPATTYNLISSHGRTDELLYYAELIGDHELVISHLVRTGQYEEALDALTALPRGTIGGSAKPPGASGSSGNAVGAVPASKADDVHYKYGPVLMRHEPYLTVNAWICAPWLDARRLLPALMRYDVSCNPPGEKQNQAIRYLEYSIKKLGNRDRAVHNYLLSLYASMGDDASLLAYLGAGGGNSGGGGGTGGGVGVGGGVTGASGASTDLADPNGDGPCFDLKYALRLCTRENRRAACVHIYSMMGLYEEAVDLALTVDIELAKDNADKPEDDEELRRKLWLRIARHVVEQEKDVKRAMEFLHSCDLLRIEDILPFFPDSVLIQDFKDEICGALEEYNRHIEELKDEMREATASAEVIRQDIKELRNRYGYVKMGQRCDLCSFPVLSRHFTLFMCQHSFHTDCLLTEVTKNLSRVQRTRVADLQQRIAVLEAEERRASGNGNGGGGGGGKSNATAIATSISTSSSSSSASASASSGANSSQQKSQQQHQQQQQGLLGNSQQTAGENADDPQAAAAAAQSELDELRSELDDLVAAECVFCGDIMIKSVDRPFVGQDEQGVVDSWKI